MKKDLMKLCRNLRKPYLVENTPMSIIGQKRANRMLIELIHEHVGYVTEALDAWAWSATSYYCSRGESIPYDVVQKLEGAAYSSLGAESEYRGFDLVRRFVETLALTNLRN